MLSTEAPRPRRRRSRLALAAALVAVGCSGSTGGGCGSSCGGAFRTRDDQGNAIKYTGSRLANVAQVRLTRSGFDFLDAGHLNDVLGALTGDSSPSHSFDTTDIGIPCFDAGTYGFCSSFISLTQFHVLAGDSNLDGACTAADRTPVHISIKSVSWILDPLHNVLRAHLVTHVKTGDVYLRTVEEHSTLCGGTSAIQGRIFYDDELPGLAQKGTVVDLDIRFSTAPDGRLEFNFSDSSLAAIANSFQPAALGVDDNLGTDPAPPVTAPYNGNGCDAASGSYFVADNGKLRCGGLFSLLGGGCDPTSFSVSGLLCQAYLSIRSSLFDQLKSAFVAKVVPLLRAQLDNLRCQRAEDAQGNAVQCNAASACPADDDGNPLSCDPGRGVCYSPFQPPSPSDPYSCEPVQLGISGRLDASGLTGKVGFPAGTRLDLFAALGSKGSGAARVDAGGLQIVVEAGTKPASPFTSLCVPPAPPSTDPAVPPIDFDDPANKPATVGGYDLAFSLAGAMLGRGFRDAYSAGLLCVAITSQTTSLISSGLFKTFVPSLDLLTGGRDVPMRILLRPTQPPSVRVGKNSFKKDPAGNDVPDDPLITLSFSKLQLDFYALVDERQVRLFTLQTDLQLPLDLRTFADPNADTLQPVLGGLDAVLTNISTLSPQGGPYDRNTDALAEDPSGVMRDLVAAAVRLAQPLLAGVLKPIALPGLLNLKFAVRGIAGAVPTADVAITGYQHLAVWAQVGACGGSTGVACASSTVKAQARVARQFLPDSLDEVRRGARPELELDLSALTARGAPTQYSYRVDGSLWSPWLGAPRLLLRDPLFLAQGRHRVEITAREAGDDRTMDPEPVAVDFFVSYQPPAVSLRQRPDGAIVTRAHSPASPAGDLRFSYRIDGQPSWTPPGPARVFTDEELGGHGLSVSVIDEAGRAAMAHFGEEEGTGLARAGMGGGCATGPRQDAWALLPLLGLALWLRRQRKGSISGG